jgi:hypothetical protein
LPLSPFSLLVLGPSEHNTTAPCAVTVTATTNYDVMSQTSHSE